MLVLMAFSLCGCASISTSVKYYSNGQVMQEITIKLDKNAITSAGYNYENISLGLYNSVSKNGLLQRWAEEAKNNYIAKVLDNFEDQTKIDAYNKGLLEAGVIRNGEDEFVMYFAFDKYEYFMYFNDIELDAGQTHIVDVPFGGEVTEEESFLINTYFQITPSLYESCLDIEFDGFANGTKDTIVNHVANLYESNKARDTVVPFTSSNITYNFSFTTPYRRLHSNADTVKKSGSNYVHTWTIPSDDLGKDIFFYRVTANSANWYIVAGGIAIGGVLLGTAICLITIQIKRIKAKKDVK